MVAHVIQRDLEEVEQRVAMYERTVVEHEQKLADAQTQLQGYLEYRSELRHFLESNGEKLTRQS